MEKRTLLSEQTRKWGSFFYFFIYSSYTREPIKAKQILTIDLYLTHVFRTNLNNLTSISSVCILSNSLTMCQLIQGDCRKHLPQCCAYFCSPGPSIALKVNLREGNCRKPLCVCMCVDIVSLSEKNGDFTFLVPDNSVLSEFCRIKNNPYLKDKNRQQKEHPAIKLSLKRIHRKSKRN